MSAFLMFILSGGGRWFLAEVLEFLKRKEERHALREEAEAEHRRKLEQAEWQAKAVKAAADAGVNLVRVKGDEDARRAADAAFDRAVAATATPLVGDAPWVTVVNAANASVRPIGAFWALLVISLDALGWLVLGTLAVEIACSFLGLFVGGRVHSTGR